jgi:hypothetical protein
MFVDTRDLNPVETVRVVDEDPLASASTASLAVFPLRWERIGGPGYRHMSDHSALTPTADRAETALPGVALALLVSWRHTRRVVTVRPSLTVRGVASEPSDPTRRLAPADLGLPGRQ